MYKITNHKIVFKIHIVGILYTEIQIKNIIINFIYYLLFLISIT